MNSQLKQCQHFQECGGCRLQQFSYIDQLKQKEQKVFELFQNIPSEDCFYFPILPTLNFWNYRNKMEFSFSSSKKGERFLGLFSKKARHKVVDLQECLLSPNWFMKVTLAVKIWWEKQEIDAYHCHSDRGALRNLTLREGKGTKDRMIVLTVSGNPEYALSCECIEDFTKVVQAALFETREEFFGHETIILRTQYIAKKTPTRFEEQILFGKGFILESFTEPKPLIFKISASSFFQPNSTQAALLYKKALELGQFSSSDFILDLYCGTGTLGIFAAQYVNKVVGIELNPDAALNAQENCSLNNISNVGIINQDVGKGLELLREEFKDKSPDGVILDPPRVGLMPEAIKHLTELLPNKIVYISCNPDTQFLNIKELIECGYHLKAIQPVDQFPHTPHIENIALLQRYSKSS